MDEQTRQLVIAAIEVITSVSQKNLRNNASTSSFLIHRTRLHALEEAVEAILPGVIDRTYKILEEQR